MSLILAFDTSTKGCSAALFDQEHCVAHKQIIEDGFVHAEQLHLLIESLFEHTRYDFSTIDAFAVGAGPGSYTGLRIGASAAKGYAFALEKPLIALDSLELLAESVGFQIKDLELEETLIFSAIDARRQEVYARIQSGKGQLIMPSQLLLLKDFNTQAMLSAHKTICVIGDASDKLNLFFSDYVDSYDFRFIHSFPNALHMGGLALNRFRSQDFVSTEYFEPNYLKEVHITPPKTG